jgi:hypothetical protein
MNNDMKLKSLLSLLCFLLFSNAFGQGIEFHSNSSYGSGYISEFEIIAKNTFVNNSIHTEFIWIRETNELPAEWTAAVCDNALCHAIEIDSAEFTLASGDSFDFKVNFYPLNNLGRGNNRIRIYAKSDPAVSATTTFYVHGWGLSINDKKTENIKVYPSPTDSKLFIDFPEANAFQWSILSTDGKLIREGHVQEKLSQIDVQNLNSGMYIIRIQNKDQIISRRFSKTY